MFCCFKLNQNYGSIICIKWISCFVTPSGWPLNEKNYITNLKIVISVS